MDSSTALQICVWRNFSDAVAWLLDVGGASLEQQDEVLLLDQSDEVMALSYLVSLTN